MKIGARTSGVRKVILFLKSFAIFIAFRPQLFKRNLHLVEDSAIQFLKGPVVISGTSLQCRRIWAGESCLFYVCTVVTAIFVMREED